MTLLSPGAAAPSHARPTSPRASPRLVAQESRVTVTKQQQQQQQISE